MTCVGLMTANDEKDKFASVANQNNGELWILNCYYEKDSFKKVYNETFLYHFFPLFFFYHYQLFSLSI